MQVFVAIVLMDHVDEGKIGVMPLFVAITEEMNVTFEGESESGDGGDGPRHEFNAAKDMTHQS